MRLKFRPPTYKPMVTGIVGGQGFGGGNVAPERLLETAAGLPKPNPEGRRDDGATFLAQALRSGGGLGAGSSMSLPGGGPSVHQQVNVNFDADNGSAIVEFIPALRDFEAGQTPTENDLVLLQLEDANPPPGPVASEGAVLYRIDVTYSGDGRVKIWDSGTKDNLLPLGAWTTAQMRPDLNGNLRYLPPFFMEGIEPSTAIEDATIQVQWLSIEPPGLRLVTCKPIQVTVTPALLDLYPDYIERPVFRLEDFGEETDNALLATWVQASVEIMALFVPPVHLPSGQRTKDVGFAQWVTGLENLLEGDAAYARATSSKYYFLHPFSVGPNRDVPIIDLASIDGTDNLPFYQNPDPFDGANQPENLPNGTTLISMDDWPRMVHDPTIQLIKYSQSFETYFIAMDGKRTDRAVAYPFGYIMWEVVFDFSGWAAATGMTTNNSFVWGMGCGYTLFRTHAAPRMAPSTFNQAITVGTR